MQIDVILEPNLTPAQVAEIAVAAEAYGVRTLWHSNYHQNPDGFVALVPAAMATSRIRLGVLAVSPFENHPLKIGNALMTLNDISNGRAVVAIGGGGAVLQAVGIESGANRSKLRMVRAVREAVEIVQAMASGEFHRDYQGEIYQVALPFKQAWTSAPPPKVFAASTREQMLEMAGRVADGTQMSDVTPEVVGERVAAVRRGLERRETPADDFRIGNFWAWHVKADAEAAWREARRELVFRGQMFPPKVDVTPYATEEERALVLQKMGSFQKAYWTRSGVVEDVPEELVDRLVRSFSSTGGLDVIDQEVERFRAFENAGVTELALRLFDDQPEGLRVIGEHVMPHFDRF
jgi:5,10-methylenetetrahydromethanopterin reductase